MSFGGGTFLTMNKVLPGAYINFVSAARASSIVGDRGTGALGLELDWGAENSIFAVDQEDIQKSCEKIFGYSYTDGKMKGLRDFFAHALKGYFYRLNNGGIQATSTFGKAKYTGTRGNSIMIAVAENIDDTAKFDVSTYFDGELMDTQTIASSADLTDNDFVLFDKTATLAATAGTYLAGGTNGTAASGTDHSNFLAALEPYNFNTLGCLSTDDTTKKLYLAYGKRMRDQVGAKFQVAVYKTTKPDYEGCINFTTPSTDVDFGESAGIYWVTGAEAGCAINKSTTNTTYDGEFEFTCETKQSNLQKAIEAGEFVFHQVDDEIRVLKDINSYVSFTKLKNRDFSLNQVIRVLDQLAVDEAKMFNNTYLGKEQNDPIGQEFLWNDYTDYGKKLLTLRAIKNFVPEDITVADGENKEDVYVENHIQPVVCMEKLYMLVTVA